MRTIPFLTFIFHGLLLSNQAFSQPDTPTQLGLRPHLGLKAGPALARYSPGGPAIISPALMVIAGVSTTAMPVALYGGCGWEQHDNPLGGRADYLVAPLYLRFLKPTSVFHLSAGMAYAWTRNGPSTRNSYLHSYYDKVYEREWSVFWEVECELQRRPQHQYSIALSSRYAFTPTLTTASPRPAPFEVYGRFLALTLNAYFSMPKPK